MRIPSFLLAAFACLALAVPADAQENNVTVGYFSTVAPRNVPDFEEAAREHAGWHADQNDTQPWALYQAVTGPLAQYVYVGGMPWSALDNPSVDPAADSEDWSDGAARFVDSQEVRMWTQIPGSGNPPDDGAAYPIVQVIEFEVAPGGLPAVMQGIHAYKEAIDAAGADLAFDWSQVVSAARAETVFLAVWARSFADLGAPGPTPLEVLSSRMGPDRASLVSEAFNGAATITSSIIWTLRPDLSYIPM